MTFNFLLAVPIRDKTSCNVVNILLITFDKLYLGNVAIN